MDIMVVQYGRTTAMPVGGLVDADNPENLQANPTLAAGDVKISKDGAAFSNVTTLPSAIGTSTALTWTPDSGELDCAYAYLKFIDQTGTKEWGDKQILILTKGDANAFYGEDVAINASGEVTVGTNNDKTGYTASTVSDKTGYKLASDGLDQITPAEPSAVPAWGTATLPQALAWVVAFFRNKQTQTSTTSTLRNDADNADLATSTTSESSGTVTKGEWS